MAYPGRPGGMTTAHQPDVYNTNSKQILVTRDPVYSHPSIQNGVFVGRQPPTHFVLAIIMTVINPILGPVALLFSYKSRSSFGQGDIKYAEKWSQYSFLISMITIVASVVIYIALIFSLSTIGYRGGHSYWAHGLQAERICDTNGNIQPAMIQMIWNSWWTNNTQYEIAAKSSNHIFYM